MADEPALLYLEPDDEITSLVRRLREADGPRVIVVAPGRAKATSSATAMRLLARIAADEGREVAVVGDALTRSLAAEAELTAFTSVDDARAARPAAPVEPQRATINVLRADDRPGEADVATAAHPIAVAPPPRPARHRPSSGGDETRVVPLAPPPRPGPREASAKRPGDRRAPRRRAWTVVGIALVALAFAVVGAGLAAIAPSATITILAATEPVGPRSYELRFPDADVARGEVTDAVEGTASGSYQFRTQAAGSVTFFNWNFVAVEVAQNTGLGAGEVVFATTEAVTVPPGELTAEGTIRAGEAGVNVVAVEPGPSGNVAAEAIDTVLHGPTARALRGFPQNPQRLVVNPGATAGGVDEARPEIVQEDVDAAVAALRDRLAGRAAEALGDPGDAVAVGPPEPFEPEITYADTLVGTRDAQTFTIEGSLAYARWSVAPAEVEAAARAELEADTTAVDSDHALLAETIRVSIEDHPRLDDEALVVPVEVVAASEPVVDEASLVGDVLGRPVEEVRARLSELGTITIDTWPGWVDTIPQLEWRVELDVIEAGPQPAPSDPSGSDAGPSAS